MIRRKQILKPAQERRGVAAVEFAVCVPVLVLVFLGSIECANMTYLKQTLTISSYEGVRKAIQYNATNSQALDRAENILTARNINNATITFDPPTVANAVKGNPVEVTVSVPCNSNSPLPLTIFDGQTLSVTIRMIKE
jgi:Flp pilus assembly protein TadG